MLALEERNKRWRPQYKNRKIREAYICPARHMGNEVTLTAEHKVNLFGHRNFLYYKPGRVEGTLEFKHDEISLAFHADDAPWLFHDPEWYKFNVFTKYYSIYGIGRTKERLPFIGWTSLTLWMHDPIWVQEIVTE
jgi:hypothetical protein